MAATVEIVIDDPADDKPSRGGAPSPGGAGGGVARVQLISPLPIPVRVIGGDWRASAPSPHSPGGGSGSPPVIGGSARRGGADPIGRNAMIGARTDRRMAVLRDKQRKERERRRKKAEGEAERERKKTEREKEQEMARVQREKDARIERGKAWRRNKTRQRRIARLKQRRAGGRALATGFAGATAAAIRGGGIGASVGGGAGAAIGGRFGGPAGAVIGGAVGEKVGGFVDNPLAGPAQFGGKVARGDGIGALNDAADTAAMALAVTVPGAGLVAGAALKTFAGAVTSTVEVMGAFAARGRELSGFSGPIAGAAARQDVTRLIADIKESQRMGDSYAKLIDKQTEFEETMKAILVPLKEKVIEFLPRIMDWLLDFSIWAIESLDKVLIGDYGLKTIADEMRKARDAARRGADAGIDIEAMFRPAFGRPFAFPAALPPAGPGGPGGLRIPIIPGP